MNETHQRRTTRRNIVEVEHNMRERIGGDVAVERRQGVRVRLDVVRHVVEVNRDVGVRALQHARKKYFA